MKKLNFIFVFASAVLLSGCYYDIAEKLYPNNGTANCDTASVNFSMSVNGILQQNCISCHNSSLTSGNVNLDGYAHVKTYADNGKLMAVITHAAGFIPMPQGGNKLSDCEINTIQKWISNGTPSN
ncbi:MAG: cytochrome c [Bacteroidia bacterium]|nr:cytochrome c [Bacteroidia bacterium]